MSDQVITIVRSIGSLTFDAVFDEAHDSDLEVTDSPVETGVTVSDHAYMFQSSPALSSGRYRELYLPCCTRSLQKDWPTSGDTKFLMRNKHPLLRQFEIEILLKRKFVGALDTPVHNDTFRHP